MEVILQQDVNKLGKAGQVVRVKDGFAHNFLIPRGLAVVSSLSNLKKLEKEKQQRNLGLERAKKHAEELRDRISKLSLTMPVLTQEEEKLYGSITSGDIQRLLKEEGFDIEKSSIMLEEPIKSLGIFEIPLKLHPEVSVNIKIWVVKK
ncbi:50S ribosomal protein L9 [bacterium]|nr:MAG: 50S ribosomal protein L9 [bacterium]